MKVCDFRNYSHICYNKGMANNIVQLKDYSDNNVYPIAGAATQGSITKAMLEEGIFEGQELSQPSSVAYVATDNIQTSAVTTPKIADGAVTSDKIDSATMDWSSIQPSTGYSVAFTRVDKKGGLVYFSGSIQVPALTSIDNQTNAFILPVGWRPKTIVNFCLIAYTGSAPTPLARLRIGPDGTVRISKIDQDIPINTYVQVSGITFVAE